MPLFVHTYIQKNTVKFHSCGSKTVGEVAFCVLECVFRVIRDLKFPGLFSIKMQKK